MGTIFPAGSGVSRISPPNLTGSSGTGDLGWQEAISVDWSAQSLHDFASDATEDIDGIEWKALNHTAGIQTDGLRIDGSAGLRIWPAGNEQIWDSQIDSPMVTVLVKDAVGVKTTYAMNKHAVCFQCTLTATQDISTQWNQIGALVMNSEVGASNGNARYLNACGFSSNLADAQVPSVRGKTAEGQSVISASTGSGDSTLVQRNFFQMVIWPGPNYIGTIVGSMGTMPGGGFPDPNDWTPLYSGAMALCTKADSSSFTLANMRFAMSSCSGGTGTDPNPIFTKCRVLYMAV